MKNQIIKKIKNDQEVIGIVGLGYVGLPLAVSFAEVGVKVIGFDKNQSKVISINTGDNYIADIRDTTLRAVVKEKLTLAATTDFTRLRECDAIIIAVPTPLDRFRKPDMSYIESAARDIGKNMKTGTFISLESTTFPTTTEEVLLPILEEESGFVQGEEFWLAYSPERVDPGNKNFNTKNTPKILGALDESGKEIGQALYKKAINSIHTVSSPRVAEMVKILENTYRLVNISLINELALLSGKMDIDIWEAIDAAKTKPFGFQAFYPGPGVGGHCIPLDPFYLEHIAKKYDFDLSMIHTAGHINMRMPHYMYIKISTALNSHKKSVNGSNILFLGVAYKANIDDSRESPALEIIDTVVHKGGNVFFNDPFVEQITTNMGNNFQSVELTAKSLSDADCVVLTTNHDVFDVNFIMEHANLIVDMRNMIATKSQRVYKL